MIEFDEVKGSNISPEGENTRIPSAKEVELFFEMHFKKNVDDYLIYKKNKFKNPNKDTLKDFIFKLENFVKVENKNDENSYLIDLLFSNIQTNIKILDNLKCLPDNKKILSFLTSFTVSKFFT
jgi:hypothetical protein